MLPTSLRKQALFKNSYLRTSSKSSFSFLISSPILSFSTSKFRSAPKYFHSRVLLLSAELLQGLGGIKREFRWRNRSLLSIAPLKRSVLHFIAPSHVRNTPSTCGRNVKGTAQSGFVFVDIHRIISLPSPMMKRTC